MAFKKIEYLVGDVLTADQMNKIQDAIITDEGNIDSHISNKSNPHGVTTSQIGASPVGHKHTKSEITDFPTSMTPTAHNHRASEITSGTLDVARGGTGVTSLSALVTALGVSKIATGSYTGTAHSASDSIMTSNTTINVGFQPDFVILFNPPSGGEQNVPGVDCAAFTQNNTVRLTGYDIRSGAQKYIYTDGFKMTPTGFTVGAITREISSAYSGNVYHCFNDNGAVYNYVAIKV